MGRPAFLQMKMPFQKESVENYTGVLVPISQAKRHPSVISKAASYGWRPSEDGSRKGSLSGKTDVGDGETGVLRTTSGTYDPYTIDGIRAEIDSEAESGGHDTIYDRRLHQYKC